MEEITFPVYMKHMEEKPKKQNYLMDFLPSLITIR